jgi:hypothetical protein
MLASGRPAMSAALPGLDAAGIWIAFFVPVLRSTT